MNEQCTKTGAVKSPSLNFRSVTTTLIGGADEASMADLEDESRKLTDLLRGKTVKVVIRQRSREVVIEFDDGTRLFVDNISDGLEFSVTG